MSNFDYLSLSGRNLKAFVAVIEEGSVSAAAKRLGLTQSAVSHTLDRLRELLGDPLFVRSGRDIVPTAHALAAADKARAVLDGMQALAAAGPFSPEGASLQLTVAANDLQRDVLLPGLIKRLEAEKADVGLRVVSSGRPGPGLLREGRCDLLITPTPPAGGDIMQKRLFSDRYVCFYDPAARPPPATLDDYLAARHVTIVYDDNEQISFDIALRRRGVERNIKVSVPGFAGVPAFLRGGELLASLPSLLGRGVMREFAACPLPFAHEPLAMYLVWHVRHQHDQRSRWLRAMVEATAAELTDDPGPVAAAVTPAA